MEIALLFESRCVGVAVCGSCGVRESRDEGSAAWANRRVGEFVISKSLCG